MSWLVRRRFEGGDGPRLPVQRGERVLASAAGAARRPVTAFATTQRFVVLDDAQETVIDRRWLEVDTGTWRAEDSTLHVTWVGESTPWRIVVDGDPRPFLEAFRERVQASVVVTSEVAAPGGGSGRVAVRRDFGGGALVVQRVLGRATAPGDPEVAAALDAAEADLREAVGLGDGGFRERA